MDGRLILLSCPPMYQRRIVDKHSPHDCSIHVFDVFSGDSAKEFLEVAKYPTKVVLCETFSLFDSRQPHNSKSTVEARRVLLGALSRGVDIVIVSYGMNTIHKFLRDRADCLLVLRPGFRSIFPILSSLLIELPKGDLVKVENVGWLVGVETWERVDN